MIYRTLGRTGINVSEVGLNIGKADIRYVEGGKSIWRRHIKK